MTSILPDPPAQPTFAPGARRRLLVHGAEVELVLLPARAARPGRPAVGRPPLLGDVSGRIIEREAVWQDEQLAVTPNRFPFAACQWIVWSRKPSREHDANLLTAAFAWSDRHGGSMLLNAVGAAASVARAHVHLTTERQPFLAALPERPFAADWLPAVDGVRFVRKDVPFCLVGVRGGTAAARAAAMSALQLCRLTAAANLVAQDGAAWLYPRSTVETPAPEFPQALGAAELWGRWCYQAAAPHAAATGPALERALLASGCPPLDA